MDTPYSNGVSFTRTTSVVSLMDNDLLPKDNEQYSHDKVHKGKGILSPTPDSPAINVRDLMEAHSIFQTERQKIEDNIKSANIGNSNSNVDRGGGHYHPHNDPKLIQQGNLNQIERVIKFLYDVAHVILWRNRVKYLSSLKGDSSFHELQ